MRKLILALPLIAVGALADNPQYSTSLLNPPGYSDIYATAMTLGPDGNVWVAEGFKARVGRLTVTFAPGTTVAKSTYTAFAAKPVVASNSIAAGPDGNVWFTEAAGKIARMTTQGAITEFSLNNPQADLAAITSGPDGALWFIDLGTFTGTTKLGRIDVNGSISEFNIGPKSVYVKDLTTGSDGSLWFVDSNGFQLYKVSTTGNVVAQYPIPNHGSQSMNSAHILLGPDGNVWFPGVNTVDRAKLDGTITEYTAPTARAFPYGLAIGADGNLWFTEHGTGQIGQLILSTVTDSGQATIVESNLFPFAISSADQLFILPAARSQSTALDAALQVGPIACALSAFLVNDIGSEPGQNLTAVELPIPTECADIAVELGRTVSRIAGANNAFQCYIHNYGPSVATNVRMTVRFSGGPDLALQPLKNETDGALSVSGSSFSVAIAELAPNNIDSQHFHSDYVEISIIGNVPVVSCWAGAFSETPDTYLLNNTTNDTFDTLLNSWVLPPESNEGHNPVTIIHR